MITATEHAMYADRRSPLIIEPGSGERNLAGLVQMNTAAIGEKLLEHGALLFRGFLLKDVADFDRFVSALTAERLDYVYGSTPRTSIGDRIYTATEYPPAQEIPLHNENAYQREWPLKVALCCLIPASSGGETPIADMRAVTAAVGERLVDRFAERRVRYVRHYHPYVDVPWQKVFNTADRADVARYCEQHEIAYEWLKGDVLRTIQVCQGTALHPVSRQRTFFNQAHLFHNSSVGVDGAKALIEIFGTDRLPRQTFYGDGEEFALEDLTRIRTAFSGASLTFPWQAGDVLLLDNMQFAHGRRPFKGTRKVIAALMESCTEASK